MRDPARLSYSEIAAEVRTLRDEITRASRRILELSHALSSRARRDDELEDRSKYLAYATGCERMAGGIEQGVKRAASLDRMIPKDEERPVAVPPTRVPRDKPRGLRGARSWSVEHSGNELAELYEGAYTKDS